MRTGLLRIRYWAIDPDTGARAELLAELKELVENLRIAVTRTELVHLRRPTPALLLGSGKALDHLELLKEVTIS